MTNLDFGPVEGGHGDGVIGHAGEGRDMVVRDEENIMLCTHFLKHLNDVPE